MAVAVEEGVPTGRRRRVVMAELRWLHDAFDEHDLLTRASAIAFQVLSALVPLLLVGLALAGFLHLRDAWQHFADRELRGQLSPTAFAFVISSAATVLDHHQAFWLSAGLVVTVWELSGAVRAVMGGLISIRRQHEDRPLRRRLALSTAIAVVLCVAVVGVAGLLVAGGALGPAGALGRSVWLLVRWAVAAVVLVGTVSLLLHATPCGPRPLRRRSLGAGITAGVWLLSSGLFALYVGNVASYGSLFGSLAALFVLVSYLYVAAIAFVVGAVIDERIRTGGQPGAPDDSMRRDSRTSATALARGCAPVPDP